jgi:hypothetical protein
LRCQDRAIEIGSFSGWTDHERHPGRNYVPLQVGTLQFSTVSTPRGWGIRR